VATTRGRAVKIGGVAVQPQGGAPRTTTTGQSTLLRPAFSFNASVLKPTMPATLTGVLDPSSVLFWRLLLVGLAVAYIWGFHVRIPIVGRVRV